MSKARIGVTPLWDDEKKRLWMHPGYMEGIERAGAIPFMLPLTDDEGLLEELAQLCDGVLFTGGQDIDPALYGQAPRIQCGALCKARDRMEALLFQRVALELDKPVWGICRGNQLFNVLLGGTLYQDLPTQQPSDVVHEQSAPYDQPVHTVHLTPDSPLHRLLGVTELPVNSHHHQAIRTLSPRLHAMAQSDDGLIEAVYMPGKKYAVAVQWHPECMLKDPRSEALFSSFVRACS